MTLNRVWLSHRDPAVAAALAEQLRQVGPVEPMILAGDPAGLRSALATPPGDVWLVLDIDLVPAVAALLHPWSGRLTVVTLLVKDPRAEKLAQMGASVSHVQQAALQLAHLWHRPTGAAPAVDVSTGRARVVVLHSPKGGAGTSTLAVHLASIWARQGQQVALVDLAPYGSAPLLCKVQQRDTGLESLVAELESAGDGQLPDSADFSRCTTTVLSEPGRLDLLAGARPRTMDRLPAAQIGPLLEQLGGLSYDLVVVDTSPEPTPRNLAALAAADQILLVAAPDYASGWNLIQCQDLLEVLQPRGERLLVLNRWLPDSPVTAGELATRLGLPVAATLPDDPLVTRIGNHGVPWDLPPASPFLEATLELAASLDAAQEVARHG